MESRQSWGDGRRRQPHVLTELGAHLWAVEVQVGGRAREELAQLGIIEGRTTIGQADTGHEALDEWQQRAQGPGRSEQPPQRRDQHQPIRRPLGGEPQCQGPAHGVTDQQCW
jgi:hypothetical protein